MIFKRLILLMLGITAVGIFFTTSFFLPLHVSLIVNGIVGFATGFTFAFLIDKWFEEK